MRLVLPLSAIAAMSIALVAARAEAATVVYFEDVAGFTEANSPLVTEDFEDTTLADGLAMTTSSVAKIIGGKFTDSMQSGRSLLLDFASFTGDVFAFGVNYDMTPGGVGNGLSLFVTFEDGTSMALDRVGPGPAKGFYGFRADRAIASLAFGPNGGGSESYTLDDLRFGGAPVIPTPPTAPVPEPATWALMIAGFGLAGASLRRRRACLPA